MKELLFGVVGLIYFVAQVIDYFSVLRDAKYYDLKTKDTLRIYKHKEEYTPFYFVGVRLAERKIIKELEALLN